MKISIDLYVYSQTFSANTELTWEYAAQIPRSPKEDKISLVFSARSKVSFHHIPFFLRHEEWARELPDSLSSQAYSAKVSLELCSFVPPHYPW